MTPYDAWLKSIAVPGEHKFPWRWAQAIMALPPDDGNWRRYKRRVNRAVKIIQRGDRRHKQARA